MGRMYCHLRAEEHGTIRALKLSHTSSHAIAKAFGRSQSTISRLYLLRTGCQWRVAQRLSEVANDAFVLCQVERAGR